MHANTLADNSRTKKLREESRKKRIIIIIVRNRVKQYVPKLRLGNIMIIVPMFF